MSEPVKRAAVIGYPVKHSLSPRLHGYWLKHYNIGGSYGAVEIAPENLPHKLKELADQGYCGLNVTVPHKEAVLRLIDDVDATAQRIGAVNTVIMHGNGRLEGRNTDAFGFTQNLLAAGFLKQTSAAVVLGAGGAARAACVALLDMGYEKIFVMNRTQNRVEKLAHELGDNKIMPTVWGSADAMKAADLLVNATSLGMQGQPPLEIGLEHLPQTAWVNDMVYVPLQTSLLKMAAERGHKTVDGLGMLLHQARPAFKAFFGRDPEVTDELRHVVLG